MEVIKVSVKDRIIPLKVHRDLFGQIALIMQCRSINLEKFFCYPLGTLLWVLLGPAGELYMSIKVALLHSLEKDAPPLTSLLRNHAAIIDESQWHKNVCQLVLQTNGFRHVGVDTFYN